MLDHKNILIVEDDPLVAMDLADSVAEAGGEVVGPVPTVREALALIATRPIDAAILDVSLRDRDVTPVATMLCDRGVAVVVHSGTPPPPEITTRCPDAPVFGKPVNMRVLIATLDKLVARAA